MNNRILLSALRVFVIPSLIWFTLMSVGVTIGMWQYWVMLVLVVAYDTLGRVMIARKLKRLP